MSTIDQAQARKHLNLELKTKIVEGLEIDTDPELLDDDQPLFGRGLQLDSLDTLEIVSIVEEEYQVYITDDQKFVFGSINRLCDYIVENLRSEEELESLPEFDE